MTDQPAFVVLRAAPGVPPGWMPADLEGRWYYRTSFPVQSWPPPPQLGDDAYQPGYAVIIPTTRVEHRDSDGAAAQVWEVHPPGGNYE